MKKVILTIILALMIASPASAKKRDMPNRNVPNKGHHFRGNPIERLINDEDMKLTDSQKKEIRAIDTKYKLKAIDLTADIKKKIVQLENYMILENYNETNLRKTDQDIETLRGELHSYKIEQFIDIVKILNNDQKKVFFEKARRMMHPMTNERIMERRRK